MVLSGLSSKNLLESRFLLDPEARPSNLSSIFLLASNPLVRYDIISKKEL